MFELSMCIIAGHEEVIEKTSNLDVVERFISGLGSVEMTMGRKAIGVIRVVSGPDIDSYRLNEYGHIMVYFAPSRMYRMSIEVDRATRFRHPWHEEVMLIGQKLGLM